VRSVSPDRMQNAVMTNVERFGPNQGISASEWIPQPKQPVSKPPEAPVRCVIPQGQGNVTGGKKISGPEHMHKSQMNGGVPNERANVLKMKNDHDHRSEASSFNFHEYGGVEGRVKQTRVLGTPQKRSGFAPPDRVHGFAPDQIENQDVPSNVQMFHTSASNFGQGTATQCIGGPEDGFERLHKQASQGPASGFARTGARVHNENSCDWALHTWDSGKAPAPVGPPAPAPVCGLARAGGRKSVTGSSVRNASSIMFG